MGAFLVIEEKPEMLELIRFLDHAGARRAQGYREDQELFARRLGWPARRLREYLKCLEGHGLLTVRRTTIDGSFGSPRAHNLYLLRCTPDEWERTLGPALAFEKHEKFSARARAVARNREAEKKRTAEPKPAKVQKPKSPSAVGVLDDSEVTVLAGAYLDESDEDLAGW